MATNAEFKPVRDDALMYGFTNFFRKEMSLWWKTSRWWTMILVFIFLLNGIFLLGLLDRGGEVNLNEDPIIATQTNFAIFGKSDESTKYAAEALSDFLLLAGMLVPFTAIILCHDSIIGERQTGTAAWILTKPLSRYAFILAKFLANAIGFLITGVIIPGVVTYYLLFFIKGIVPNPINYSLAVGLIFPNVLFYMAVVLFLGTFSKARFLILGIPSFFLLLLNQVLGMLLPFTDCLFSRSFFASTSANLQPLSQYLLLGAPMENGISIIMTISWIFVFLYLGFRIFKREEL